MRPYTFTYICPNELCEAEIECTVTPERPPPPCSNHDSLAFSDPGDSGEVECPEFCPLCGFALNDDKVYEEGMEWLSTEEPDPPDPPEDWERYDRDCDYWNRTK